MVFILGVYTLLETCLLIPLVYGRRMKLSPLVVLVSLLLGGTVADVPGMIAILPLIAAYPPIERRWLRSKEELEETVEIYNERAKLNKILGYGLNVWQSALYGLSPNPANFCRSLYILLWLGTGLKSTV